MKEDIHRGEVLAVKTILIICKSPSDLCYRKEEIYPFAVGKNQQIKIRSTVTGCVKQKRVISLQTDCVENPL